MRGSSVSVWQGKSGGENGEAVVRGVVGEWREW